MRIAVLDTLPRREVPSIVDQHIKAAPKSLLDVLGRRPHRVYRGDVHGERPDLRLRVVRIGRGLVDRGDGLGQGRPGGQGDLGAAGRGEGGGGGQADASRGAGDEHRLAAQVGAGGGDVRVRIMV